MSGKARNNETIRIRFTSRKNILLQLIPNSACFEKKNILLFSSPTLGIIIPSLLLSYLIIALFKYTFVLKSSRSRLCFFTGIVKQLFSKTIIYFLSNQYINLFY